MALQHLRSSTADKRPTPAAMSDGQLALNTNLASPGLFFKDSNGDSVKIGPVHVGTTAPNVTPGAGGQAGNSKGEAWLDTTAANPILKVWNGSAFVAVQPVGTGTVVSTADTGTVTSTMILDGTILNADVNASAAIAGTKISPDFGSQTIASTGVFSHALGAAATPSITFTGDLNTGIYSPGADQLAISTGGSGKLFIDSAGVITTDNGFASGRLNVVNTNTVATFDRMLLLRSSNLSNAFLGLGSDSFYVASASNAPIVFCTDSDGGTSGSSVPTNERLRITSAGLVGIGTSAPGSQLDIVAQDNIRGTGFQPFWTLRDSNDSNKGIRLQTAGGAGLFYTDSVGDGTWVERLRIDSAGLVGIGTSAPGYPLDLQSESGGAGLRIRGGSGGSSVIQFTDNAISSQWGAITTAPTSCNIEHSAIVRFGTASTERMRIDSSGLVGIGTTSPRNTLDVNGGVILASGSNLTWGNVYGAGIPTIVGSSGTLQFYPNGSTSGESARIDSSGRLLIGTSTARTYTTGGAGGNHKLQLETAGATSVFTTAGIYSNSDVAGIGAYLELGRSKGTALGAVTAVALNDILGEIRFAGTNGTGANSAASIAGYVDGAVSGGGANDMPGRLVFSTTADGGSSPTTRLTIASNGDFRIANTGFFHPVTDNAVSLGLSGFRWSAVWAANGTIQTSDQRAKSGITNATLGSDFIKALRPVSYRWIEGGKRDTGERDEDNNYIYESVSGTRTHWGFIAQEVKQAVDDAGVDFGGWVLTDKDDPDSQQALRYDQFIAPLTKALQEALAEIDVLKAKVAALESA